MNSTIYRIISGVLGAPGIVAVLLLSTTVVGAAEDDIGIAAYASAEEPPTFDDPAAAIAAFKAALTADDLGGLAKLLGLDAAKLKTDETSLSIFAQLRDGAARQVAVMDLGNRKILRIGAKLWPLPFPIVRGDDAKWAFDTYSGLEEIVNRRVGENELEAISSVRAYVDAQMDYAFQDRDNDGVLEFAQKLISSEGAADGLYWPATEAAGESPAGEFIDQTALADAKQGNGYFGYRFRILTAQGDRIAGGGYDYVINGNMIAGFALIAWPVKYGETGVHTFAVNQSGIVYEVDLGPATEEIVRHIDIFNPDESWNVVVE